METLLQLECGGAASTDGDFITVADNLLNTELFITAYTDLNSSDVFGFLGILCLVISVVTVVFVYSVSHLEVLVLMVLCKLSFIIIIIIRIIGSFMTM